MRVLRSVILSAAKTLHYCIGDPSVAGSLSGQQIAMIRPMQPSDTPTLVAMALGTAAFKPIEIQALEEVLDDFHAQNAAAGHRAVVLEADGKVVGFAYFAAAAMTDRTWSLWWIVVDRAVQARGIGGKLLQYVEAAVRSVGGRQLVLETSSQP